MKDEKLLGGLEGFSRTMRALGVRRFWMLAGMPMLILTTEDHETGEPYEISWPCPARLADGYVLVADYAMGRRWVAPNWYRNLLANPSVEVAARGEGTRTMQARVVTEAERAELWPQIVAAWSRYGEHQQRTGHQAPVIVVEPGAPDGRRAGAHVSGVGP